MGQAGPAVHGSRARARRLQTKKQRDDSRVALEGAEACPELQITSFLPNIFKADDLTILQMEKLKLVLHSVIKSIFLRSCPECRLPGKQLLQFGFSERAGFRWRLTRICWGVSQRARGSSRTSFLLVTVSSGFCCNVAYNLRGKLELINF